MDVTINMKIDSFQFFNSSADDPEQAVSFSPDIVHSLHALRTANWLESLLCICPIPRTVTLTGTDYNALLDGKISSDQFEKILDKAAAVVVFHDEAYNCLKKYYNHATEKVYVIAQGVDIAKHNHDRVTVRAKYGLHLNDVVFLMVSGIRPVKNICYAVNAFLKIEKYCPDAKLLLVGPAIEDKETQKVISTAENLAGFSYLGEKPPQEVRELMSAADVFLNTSLNEGMPGAELEAMAEGLPLLASRVPGNSSLVREGENGFLVSPDNPDELIRSAINLASDKTLRIKLGNYGRQIIAGSHSVEQEIDRYESIFNIVLKKNP